MMLVWILTVIVLLYMTVSQAPLYLSSTSVSSDLKVLYKSVIIIRLLLFSPRKFSETVNMRFDYVPEIGDIIGRNVLGRLCPLKFSETVNMHFD